MKKLFSKQNLSSLFFYISILIFIIGFNFSDNPLQSGWYQQFLPFINNRPISDLTFIDSLTGFAVTPYTSNDTAYILRTVTGGDNWSIIFKGPTNIIGGFNRVQFLNLDTGYVCGNFLRRTTNGGQNWFNVNTSGIFPENMYVLNTDTIWIIDSDALSGGVYHTTNGGISWQGQSVMGGNPDHIYMYNGRIGFISRANQYIQKTTNSGQNWFVVVNNKSFNDIIFTDSLKGWSALDSVRITTDGGFNWQSQVLPYGMFNGGYLNYSYIFKFTKINKDTIWGVGGRIAFPNLQLRGLIYKTTNGGSNWLFQLPDTSINIPQYIHTKFVNKLVGWAYGGPTGIHTITGGDTTWFTGIIKTNDISPKQFELKQNYPNPFNTSSKIKFSVSSNVKGKTSDVKIKVYDIIGREVSILLDKKLSPGEYEITFDAKDLTSGVYFYSLIADNKQIVTKKMMLLK